MVIPFCHYHFWPWLVLIVSVGIHIVVIHIIIIQNPLNYIFEIFLVHIFKISDKNSSPWVP
jgi:hypothetical protein